MEPLVLLSDGLTDRKLRPSDAVPFCSLSASLSAFLQGTPPVREGRPDPGCEGLPSTLSGVHCWVVQNWILNYPSFRFRKMRQIWN